MSDLIDRLWSKGFLPPPGERWTLEDHDKVRALQIRIAELETRIERMTSGLESIEHTAADLQDPVKQRGPTVNKHD